MNDEHRLFALALRTVPPEWREAVASDLVEEVRERAQGRRMRALWLSWQAFAIGVRFRWRHLTEWTRVGYRTGLGSGWGTDAKLAFRSMRRRPWPVLAIALTLGFGIGSATATYAVFNHVVFRPVPGVVDEDALVTAYYQRGDESAPLRTSASYAHFEAMRDGSGALEGLVAWDRRNEAFTTSPATGPDVVPVTAVTEGYFEVLGVRARTGRFFSAEEYAAGHPVLVISERFAAEHFHGDGAPIGREVLLNGAPYTVIGVAAEFRGLERVGGDDVWAPFRGSPDNRGAGTADLGVSLMFGRLRPGGTLDRAREEMRAAFLDVGAVTIRGMTFEPVLFQGLTDGIGLERSRLMRMYWILMAGSATLFVLACANGANLLLARNLRRRGDLAIRAAMGAGRGRLARELTVESVCIALLAGGCGLGAASMLMVLLRGIPVLEYMPPLDDVSLDLRVLTFCAGAAAATILLFGLGPAFSASRSATSGGAAVATHVTPRTGAARTALVTLQVALAFALLVGTGLLVGTSWRLQSLDLGLDADGVVSFRLAPYRLGRDDARTDEILRETHARLSAVEGFDGVALSWDGPFSSHQSLYVTGLDASAAPTLEIMHPVSADYFETLGLPIVAGSTFSIAERTPDVATRPVVVNESFARKWFGSTSVVGRTVDARDGRRDVVLEIVGVAGDVRYRELREGFPPMIYQSADGALRIGTFLIRSSLPESEVISITRGIVGEIDPLLPMEEVSTLRDDLRRQLTEERLLARIGSVLASLAGLLAVAGLYGVIAFFVQERMRELAIRMALGASRQDVAGEVIRRVLVIVAVGLGCGLALVAATSRLLASRLYDVGPLDPPTIATAAALLMAAGLLAAWLPARRAAKQDPMVSLRCG